MIKRVILIVMLILILMITAACGSTGDSKMDAAFEEIKTIDEEKNLGPSDFNITSVKLNEETVRIRVKVPRMENYDGEDVSAWTDPVGKEAVKILNEKGASYSEVEVWGKCIREGSEGALFGKTVYDGQKFSYENGL